LAVSHPEVPKLSLTPPVEARLAVAVGDSREETFVTAIETGIVTAIEIEIETVTFVTFEMAHHFGAIQTAIGAGGIVISMPAILVSALDALDHPREIFEIPATPVAGMVTSFECGEIPVIV
jgi:hypothetical protein